MERWVFVKQSAGLYEVSDNGRVRSRHRRRMSASPFIILRTRMVGQYQGVTLYVNGTRRHAYVHQLVAEHFIGERPPDMDVRHLDGNPLNNRADNLAYGTRQENVQDSIRHGKIRRGVFNPSSNLSESDVRELLRDGRNGVSGVELAKRHSISASAVSRILRGRSYQDVQGERPDREKRCPGCEVLFTAHRPDQVYCTRRCKEQASLLRLRTANSDRRRTCAECSQEYVLKRSDQVFCTRECKTRASNRKRSELKRLQKE